MPNSQWSNQETTETFSPSNCQAFLDALNGFTLDKSPSISEKKELSIKERKKRNTMSFTMKRISTDEPQTDLPAAENQDSTKVSSFACRADVIYKKILRDFRRYFIADFNTVTGYKDSKKTKASEIVRLLELYVDQVFGANLDSKEEVMFAVGALIFPAQLCKTSLMKSCKQKKDANKIHDTLYRLSIIKVDNLLADWGVCFLLRRFINNPENTENLIEAFKVCSESYQTAFELIERRVEETLSVFHVNYTSN